MDDWRSQVWEEIERLDSSSSEAAARDVGDVNEDPLFILIKPYDGVTVLDLVTTDGVPFNKLMTVLAHDCLQISHWRQEVGQVPYLPPFQFVPQNQNVNSSSVQLYDNCSSNVRLTHRLYRKSTRA